MSNKTTFRHDEIAVNYHDAVIYGSDLSLLDSATAWLNDACIHFELTRLQQLHVSSSIFLDPSVISFLMHQCTDDEDYQDFRQGYDFTKARKMFAPINDGHAASYQRPGAGSHWSLLMFTMGGDKRQYWHFDSVSGNNLYAARTVASKLEKVINDSGGVQREEANVIDCKTPQQANGYDCGLHMLVNAEVLAPLEEDDQDSYEQALWQRVNTHKAFALAKRNEMAHDIRRLAVEYSKL